MARFSFYLHCAAVNGRVASAPASQYALPCDDAPETPQGPGWFESSWELTHGLEVRESQAGDAPLRDAFDAAHDWPVALQLP